jgi:hypothetical protein
MKFLKQLLVAFTLTVASFGANATIAPAPATHDLGSIHEIGGSLFGFYDVYNFSLTEDSFGTADLYYISKSDITLKLYNYDTSSFVSSITGSPVFGHISLAGNLSAGNYGLKVTSKRGAGYKLIGSVSPVPEASTFAMMLAGFGLVGLMSYRRKTA